MSTSTTNNNSNFTTTNNSSYQSSTFVNYFGRDFASLRQNLIDYAKSRFSTTFAYLNDQSPDMLYIELLSYLGDSLGYQLDRAFLESFRSTAQSTDSLVRIAKDLGFYSYFPKPSSLQATVSITVPSAPNSDGTALIPDPNYMIAILSGMQVQSTNGLYFECLDEINFADTTLQVIIPNYDSNNRLLNFTIQKTIVLQAGQTKVQRFYVTPTNSQPFMEVIINDTNVTQIIGVAPVSGNVYDLPNDSDFTNLDTCYIEVDNLAQASVFVPVNPSQQILDELVNLYTDITINYGEWVNVPKRFIIRRDKNNQASLIFGSTLVDYSYWNQLISSYNVNSLANFSLNQVLNNMALGQVPPPNTSLFIKYRSGAGVATNIPTNQTFTITDQRFIAPPITANLSILQTVRNSIVVTSLTPAVGGTDFMTNEEIRNSSAKIFSTNDRAVNYQDVLTLINSMPPEFGKPFRTSYQEVAPQVLNYTQIVNYINTQLTSLLTQVTTTDRAQLITTIQTFLANLPTETIAVQNSTGISFQQTSDAILNNSPSIWLGEKCRLYVLGIDANNNPLSIYTDNNGVLQSANVLMKNNIKNYLLTKRLIGDWIDIVDCRVVNFQVQFTVLATAKNSQQVLVDCLTTLRDYFNVYNWQINQPIFIANVTTVLQQIEGVINVVSLQFINIFGTDSTTGLVYAPAATGRYRNNNNVSLNSYNNKFLMNSTNNIINGYQDTFMCCLYSQNDIMGQCITG